MAVEHPQTAIHVHQSRLAHEIKFALIMHEDIEPSAIR